MLFGPKQKDLTISTKIISKADWNNEKKETKETMFVKVQGFFWKTCIYHMWGEEALLFLFEEEEGGIAHYFSRLKFGEFFSPAAGSKLFWGNTDDINFPPDLPPPPQHTLFRGFVSEYPRRAKRQKIWVSFIILLIFTTVVTCQSSCLW